MTLQMPTKAAEEKRKSALLSYLSLFTSLGTLLCCALPSLLVLFGLGATVASFLTSVPWLVSLSRHKTWTFAIAGALIASDFAYIYAFAPRLRMQDEACSIEDGPTACDRATRLSRITLWVAAAIYAIGFFTAYLLGPILAHTG
ncbi:MAG TPA: hypothetical protein VNE63_12085 [Candidatus Acidoferrales bacterium]|nr:hypothetical protein [Candidatus Acidoferrales bacterium]